MGRCHPIWGKREEEKGTRKGKTEAGNPKSDKACRGGSYSQNSRKEKKTGDKKTRKRKFQFFSEKKKQSQAGGGGV